MIADGLDDHQHRHREQHAPDVPDPAPEEQPDEDRHGVHRAARLVSHGVSRNPSRLVMTSDTPDTISAILMVPNCRKADDRGAAGDDAPGRNTESS